MLDRINECNSCPKRAYCEFFTPGEWCYVDERITAMLNSREESFRVKLRLLIGRMMRDFGHGADKRKDKISKEMSGLMEELPEYQKMKKEFKEEEKNAGLQESDSVEKST